MSVTQEHRFAVLIKRCSGEKLNVRECE